MNKIIATTISGLCIVGLAAAQTTQKPAATPKEIPCPIMPSHKVNIATATKSKMFADYKGNRYFFCCGGCPAEFKANPAKYAKSASIPTPKTKTPTK
jgi:YHS domain-containing protein